MKRSLLALALALPFTAAAQQTLPLKETRGHLFANVLLNDTLPARAMLESGIVFPLIDSALVWSHPELFRPEKLARPLRFHMANGNRYAARYKLPPGLSLAGSRSLCETYVVDMKGYACDLLYSIHTFSTDSTDRPGIFELSIRDGVLRSLPADSLPASDDGWTVCPMCPDTTTGMYCVRMPLSMRDEDGGTTDCRSELIVDLGNANLLALFTFNPAVDDFVSRTGIPRQSVETASGRTVRIVLPARTRFADLEAFKRQPVLLLDRKMRLPGDGFLGTRFFERFRTIFDFRNERLWLAAQPEQE